MKTRPLLLLVALAVARLAADTVTTDTAVFMQADAASPVIARLKSGDTVVYTGEAPAGWRRVEVSGPFEAYAFSRDITKALDVREGANILVEPSKTAAVLTVAQKGDKAEVTGLAGRHGEFCQIKLEKKIQGFIATGLTANIPAAGTTPLPASLPPPPAANNALAPGHPVAITGDTASLPRVFSGTLVIARRAILNPFPPYDFQLTDSGGRRFAYVDTKRLVLTDKIQTYLGLVVSVSGTIRNTVDGKDLVIEAETIRRN
jgi:hypothetical protein